MNTNTMMGFIVLLILATVLGDTESDVLQKEMQERLDMELKDLPLTEMEEKILLQEFEALESALLEDDLPEEAEETRNSREKRCNAINTPCKKGSSICCSGLVCTEPSLYGIWWGTYFCERPKKS
uniref:U12-Hexatoxin-Hf1a_2 n=1 Tax=Hadronyche formidabilis TaxID=426499 RepID=A0A4Q8K9F4_HADFO